MENLVAKKKLSLGLRTTLIVAVALSGFIMFCVGVANFHKYPLNDLQNAIDREHYVIVALVGSALFVVGLMMICCLTPEWGDPIQKQVRVRRRYESLI